MASWYEEPAKRNTNPFTKLKAGIVRLHKLPITQLKIIGDSAVSKIRERTLTGNDVDGNEFQPYSKSYAKVRYDSGLGVNLVNLQVSETMLNSIYSSVPNLNDIWIGATDIKAVWHNEGEGVPKREFMGLGNDEVDDIESQIIALLEKQITNII